MRLLPILPTVLALLVAATTARAAAKMEAPAPPRDLAIEMGAPFHDHAVLQQQMPVPVWGWSTPGTTVSVEFAGQNHSTTTAGDGRWSLELDPLTATFEPRSMTIRSSDGRTEVLQDLLVGEVWMCSGQSNMQWLAGESNVGLLLIPEILARVEAGHERMPVIREVKVTNKFSSIHPSYRLKGQWSTNWSGFSAIAFAFAYEIAREVQVPVGIVNGAFSTTRIQAWVPREGFAGGTDAYTREIYRKVLQNDETTAEHRDAWAAFEKDIRAWALESKQRTLRGLAPKPRPAVPGNMEGNRDPTWMCNGKLTAMAPYPIRGAIWNQGYASQSEGIAYRNNLHSLIRGWRAIWNNPQLPVYFHQFYAGKSGGTQFILNDDTQEMRLGTWLASRDIPHTGMASQIDITGGIHYRHKTVPGQRLARHALKSQYGMDIVADGPMFRDYTVTGNKLVVTLDHADGLCLGRNMTDPKGYANAVRIDNNPDHPVMFHLADANHVWHPADWRIVGSTIELSAAGVDAPRGVAYGRMAQGNQPGIYNQAMLPMTPFIFYDHKLVVSSQWTPDHLAIPGLENSPPIYPWPSDHFEVAGETSDPKTYGLQAEHYKLWLLAPQFTDHAVIQSGVPTRIYGMALPDSVVSVKFAGFEQSITIDADHPEWEMTVPAMPASAEPQVLHVTCTLDGKLAHERRITNIVVGDVWYVAANELRITPHPSMEQGGPASPSAWDGGNPQLRMMMSLGKTSETMPTRYKLNASGKPESKQFARWSPPVGLAMELATRIHARTGMPVGIVVLNPRSSKTSTISLKGWTGFHHLADVPAWQPDHQQLLPLMQPQPEAWVSHADAYLESWHGFWEKVRNDPSFDSGRMPPFPGQSTATTDATTIYNQSICAFSPGNFKAILFLPSASLTSGDSADGYGRKLSAMANSWKEAFARGQQRIDPHFVVAMPDAALVPGLDTPAAIHGRHSIIPCRAWPQIKETRDGRQIITTIDEPLKQLLGDAVAKVYP